MKFDFPPKPQDQAAVGENPVEIGEKDDSVLALARLFAAMDEIESKKALPGDMASTIEEMTELLRVIAKTNEPEDYKKFRDEAHFKRLRIGNKYLIRNLLARDLNEKIIAYLQSVGIEVSPEERETVVDHFRAKDAEKRQATLRSYADNGLLTLKSAIERGVLSESSATPGDFSSMEALQDFSLEEHHNIRGYELGAEDVNDELFYGRNSFFNVVLERGGEDIDRAGQLPKEEVENRLRNSIIFVLRADKLEISHRADNTNKEDIVGRDIAPEEIDYLVVDPANLALAEEAFGHLPVKIVAADSVESDLQNLFGGPYTLPDYKGAIGTIAEDAGRVWCHIARLPVETYPDKKE